MSRRYRIAIVGAGIGAQHLAAYLAHPELYEAAIVCDLDRERAAGLAATAPGCRVATSLDEVLTLPEVDLVDICLPPYLHHEAILAALAAGKHVACEKPLVGSLAQVDEVDRAARAAGRLLLPVYRYRFGNGLARLRRLIELGLAGTPLVAAIETHWNRTAAYYAVPWRGRRASELGGAVLSHAIHAYDLLTVALGPVRFLSARIASRVNAIETEDCAGVLFEMTSGALVHLVDHARLRNRHLAAALLLQGADRGERARALPAGRRSLDVHGPRPFAPAGARRRARGFVPHEEGFARLFALFHGTLEGSRPPPVTVADARASLELVTAIYHARPRGAGSSCRWRAIIRATADGCQAASPETSSSQPQGRSPWRE